jgi:lipoprotein-anchoring transpeptidase ErfK/SrfK
MAEWVPIHFGDRTLRRILLLCFIFSVGGPLCAVAQTQPLEDIVEEALERTGPPEAALPPVQRPPTSAVPSRLGIRQVPRLVPSVAQPTPPVLPTEPQSPEIAVIPPPAVPAIPPPASAPPSEKQLQPGERTMAQLTVDEVNAATYREAAEDIHGASPLILKTQILLDRAGASPGVIDSLYGSNVAKAIASVETVLGLPVDGRLDRKVWEALGGDNARPVLVSYAITVEDMSYPFLPSIPSDYGEQAQLPGLYFTSPEEMFAERFHMDIKLLKALNAGANFRSVGGAIVVASIEGQPVTGKIARIEADKARRQVRAYDAADRLIVAYPATIGSSDNPSPSGIHRVEGVAPNPVYYYDPRNFVQANNRQKLQLPPGPNNPVGTMWIDLSEPSYGIHGTPEPSRIDKTGSHGCIRLTNWDAEELSTLVEPGVVVEFVE